MQDKKSKNKVEDAVIIADDQSINFVEATVKNEVVKFNIAEAEIAKLIERASGLSVESIEDVEKYNEIKALHKEFVSTRTAIDKKRKEINEPFAEIVKGVNKIGADYTSKLAPSELALATEKSKFEAWKKEEDDRAEKEAEEKLNGRVEELKSSGLEFNNESGLYEVGEDISLDIVTIKKLSDFEFTAVNEKIKIARKKIDAKIEEDRIQREAEEAKQKAITEKNEADRLEIRAEKLELRSGKLIDLGFIENEALDRFEYSGAGKSIVLTFDQIAEMSAGDFKDTVKNYAEIIETAKEEERLKQIETDNLKELNRRTVALRGLNLVKDNAGNYFYAGMEVIKSEIASDLTIDFDIIYFDLVKAIAEIDKKIKADKDEENRLREEEIERLKTEAMPDLDKIERYLKEIQAITVPLMKTDAGIKILEDLTAQIRKMSATAESLIKNVKTK